LCGHGLVGGFGHGGLGGCVGVGWTTGGTTTGGTTTGGTTTGGITTGGTTTGGTTTVTGGSGTSIVTVTGFDRLGGFAPVPDGADEGAPVCAGVVAGVVDGVTAVGAGLADGVGRLVAVGVEVAECRLGTTISGLPPPVWGAEPKYEPATG
jgi:hypothetical protein